MTGDDLCERHDKISIRQRHNPSGVSSFELADFDYTSNAPRENDDCNPRPRISDTRSSEMLSTTELISTVSYVWNCAREPLSHLLSKSKHEVIQEADILYSIDEETLCTSRFANDRPGSCYLNNKTNSAKLGQGNFERKKVSCPRLYENYSFWRIYLANSSTVDGFHVRNCTGMPFKMGSIYGWMNEAAFGKPKNQDNSMRIEEKITVNCSTNPASGCVPTDTTSSFPKSTSGNFACDLEPAEPVEVVNIDLKASSTTCSENEIIHSQDIEANDHEIYISRFDTELQDIALASCSHDCENRIKETDDGLHMHQKNQGIGSEIDISFSDKKKPHSALAKQEHAFAGAMAGIFVSLCLHPMDTVKTVIQSCRANQLPLHHVGRSILSERGVTGLYRGISSNILTSAPISAIYTFTYESVKKTLLPFLPKEYHSLAHCTAGGCASIATSFIFTPSERIKQQMQVGSHYRNCWNALIEVVQKGGVPSLYAGWRAVLCRNVPHSIIKFYTYESLKRIMVPPVQSDAQPNTLATLVCGGLAGSMASLFSTPFDVVKTRLQTQIPGSTSQYSGVFNALREIRKHEGLKGLYRGLTPRLVMYMIQGALFFASYESFKSLFSLEIPQLSQTLHPEQNRKDDSVPAVASVAA